jgi:hypothetical protein
MQQIISIFQLNSMLFKANKITGVVHSIFLARAYDTIEGCLLLGLFQSLGTTYSVCSKSADD